MPGTYVELAQAAGASIPQPAPFAYPWGDALDIWAQMAPDVRVINLETSVIHSAEERAVRDSALRQFLESGSRFIYLDQMNLSSRARSPYLSPDNFNVAVVLEAGLEIVLERHRSRPDKAEIPESAVVSGYRRLEMLKDQEFDLVVLYEPEME